MHLKWSWPCFWSSGSRGSSDEDDLDPVLLVSGVGGSILNSMKKSKLGFESRVWVRLFLADLEFKKRLSEPSDDSSEIVIPEDDYRLYAIDVQDPTMVTKCVHVSELIECPSFYEMLPNPKFVREDTPEIHVWRKQSQDDSAELKSYGPTKSITVFEEALKNNEACGTRQILDTAQLPDGVSFYNIYGTSFDTPFNVCYDSEDSPIEDWSNICYTIPQYSYVDGMELFQLNQQSRSQLPSSLTPITHRFFSSSPPSRSIGPFHDNIRKFLQDCAESEDYNVDGMPVWCTLLVHTDDNIENEYGPQGKTLGAAGHNYMTWAANMAVGLGTGVPWVMCKQEDALDPMAKVNAPPPGSALIQKIECLTDAPA